MIDIGLSKIALIGAVALVVIGPEKLPRVARTVGNLLGRAQRYVSDVKAEVNRSIELDELRKMQSTFSDTVHAVQQSVSQELDAVGAVWAAPDSADAAVYTPAYQPPRKNWRLKRSQIPRWYKARHGVRAQALSGAARVARYRPSVSSNSGPSFF